MPVFNYSAIDPHGSPVSGHIDADDEAAARRLLAERGLKANSLEPADRRETYALSGNLSAEETLQLTSQLSVLVESELQMSDGLRAVAAEFPQRRLARVLFSLARKLEAGTPLDQAVMSPEIRLPRYAQGLLASGVRAGALGEVIEQFLTHQRLALDLNRRLWLALAYPVLLLVLLAFWLVFILAGVIAQIREMFVGLDLDFGNSLPKNTRLIVSLGEPGWGKYLLAAVCGLALMFLLLRVLGGAGFISDLLGDIPLFGPIWKFSGLTRFCDLLAILVQHQVALPQALEWAADGVQFAGIAAAARHAGQNVGRGAKLAESLGPPFPPTMIPVVAWGEDHSALPQALHSLSEVFRDRVDEQADLLVRLLPPFVLILVGTTVLGISVGVYGLIQVVTVFGL